MIDVDRLFRDHARELERSVRRRFAGSSVPDVVIEDACAQAWLIAWRERDRVEPDNVVAWLVVVAVHEVIALLKKRRREADGDLLELTAAATCDADPELALELRAALEALAALNPNQRLALELRAAGYRYTEIQELLGRTYT
jgi:RNA polymerase sigma factor (sigma-70 family)